MNHLKEFNEETLNLELGYALDKIKAVPMNESPYSYIRGLFNLPTKNKFKMIEFKQIKEEMKKIVESNTECYHAYSILLDVYEEEKSKENFDQTLDILVKIDFIRRKYWGWRKSQYIQ